MMTIPLSLRRKYSWGPIPQWEIDALSPALVTNAEPPKPRRGRPPKVMNGNNDADRNKGA